MKVRLDRLLVERGLAESREQARRMVLGGDVRVNDRGAFKSAERISGDAEIVLKKAPEFVSRGGDKLARAFDAFDFDVRGRRCLDVGASTGGFTDCLLRRGAEAVIALDVGRGQLHWKLRNDPRVVVMERFNARHLSPGDLPWRPSRAVVDVAFISLKRILPPLREVLAPGAEIITLIKPQFEAGRAEVRRGGVVRDETVRRRVVETLHAFGERECGLTWMGECVSPLRGPHGNVEFLAWWRCPQ